LIHSTEKDGAHKSQKDLFGNTLEIACQECEKTYNREVVFWYYVGLIILP